MGSDIATERRVGSLTPIAAFNPTTGSHNYQKRTLSDAKGALVRSLKRPNPEPADGRTLVHNIHTSYPQVSVISAGD